MVKRLADAGVAVLHKEYAQTLHGFVYFPGTEPAARECWADIGAFINQ
jgi:acetyl esterase/lipase